MSELEEHVAMSMRRRMHKLDEDHRPMVPWGKSKNRAEWLALAAAAIAVCEKAGIVQREKEERKKRNNFPKRRVLVGG